MADVITRLKLESGEYDSKIKRATQGLLQMEQECRNVGGTLAILEKDQKQFVQGLGNMQTVSTSVRGKIGELSSAFVELRSQYNRLTDEEKKGDFGRALSASLGQLKTRVSDAKKELADITQELNAGGNKFGQFGKILDGIGQKMGLNANITELVTSRTALMAGGIGAATAIIGKAASAWANYNAELARQDQVTQVTTGLQGPDADRMTDTMRALSDTYGVDFRESINAANTLMSQFGATGDEAIQLIKDGMQGMIQGDGPKLLSMIQQYAPAFRDAGVSADQLVAVIHNSEGGIFTDQNMNAIVMGIKNIRLMTNATRKALAGLGIDGDEMTRKLNDGAMSLFDALKQVAQTIEGTSSSSQAAGMVMQQVFGRQGAMAGTNLGKAIASLNLNLEETKKQTGEVGESFQELQTANEKLNRAIRDCFEYDGWDAMARGIKANLVTALASVVEWLGKIKNGLAGVLGSAPVETQQGDEANGGGSFIDRAVGRLGQWKTQSGARSMYNAQMNAYDQLAGEISYQIREIERAVQSNGVSSQGEANAVTKTLTDLRNRLEAVRRNQREYDTRAQKVIAGLGSGNTPNTPDSIINPTGKTTTTKTSPAQQAADRVAKAEEARAMAIEQAAIEVKAGTATEADAKKREYQAVEKLWQAYGEAYNTTKDPRYKQAQDTLADEIVKLGGEVTRTADAQKASEKAARELEQANKKYAEAMNGAGDARMKNDLKAFYKARKQYKAAGGENDIQAQAAQVKSITATVTIDADAKEAMQKLQEVKGVTIDPKTLTVTATTEEAVQKLQEVEGVTIDPKTVKIEYKDEGFTATTANIDAFIGNLKQRISESEVGTDLYNNLTAQLADTTALSNIIQTAIKNGIDTAQFDPQDLWKKIFGETPGDYIDTETWEQIAEEISKTTKKKIKIDGHTGETSGKEEANVGEVLSKLSGGLSSISSGIQSLGVKLPEGLERCISTLQGISGILQGIHVIVSAIKAISTISSFISLSNGGVVHAANGYIVPGNFGYDAVPSLLTSGEVVLNQAQQNNLLSALEDSDSRVSAAIAPYVTGETIFLGISNHLNRAGYGEIVTTSMLRRMGILK